MPYALCPTPSVYPARPVPPRDGTGACPVGPEDRTWVGHSHNDRTGACPVYPLNAVILLFNWGSSGRWYWGEMFTPWNPKAIPLGPFSISLV